MHISVLVTKTLEYLNLKPGDNVIDATLDGGGHSKLFLKAIAPYGKVLGIEQDSRIIKNLEAENIKNLIIVNDNFRNIAEIAQKNNFQPNAIFFDLGISTWHLKESGKGFSFQKPNEVLDMRISQDTEFTVAEIINSYSSEKLAGIFKEFGEEGRANFFAKKITEERKKHKIITVNDFIKALQTKHPKVLARIFQSLRIYINDEINSLREGLAGAFEVLNNHGRMVVLSYHSLEDREVKKFFKKIEQTKQGKTLKKPINPERQEIQKNSSARSAKLRILWKI